MLIICLLCPCQMSTSIEFKDFLNPYGLLKGIFLKQVYSDENREKERLS